MIRSPQRAERTASIADVDNDGWLDIVTSPVHGGVLIDSPSQHPRIYINLGELKGAWLGLEHS